MCCISAWRKSEDRGRLFRRKRIRLRRQHQFINERSGGFCARSTPPCHICVVVTAMASHREHNKARMMARENFPPSPRGCLLKSKSYCVESLSFTHVVILDGCWVSGMMDGQTDGWRGRLDTHPSKVKALNHIHIQTPAPVRPPRESVKEGNYLVPPTANSSKNI